MMMRRETWCEHLSESTEGVDYGKAYSKHQLDSCLSGPHKLSQAKELYIVFYPCALLHRIFICSSDIANQVLWRFSFLHYVPEGLILNSLMSNGVHNHHKHQTEGTS